MWATFKDNGSFDVLPSVISADYRYNIRLTSKKVCETLSSDS